MSIATPRSPVCWCRSLDGSCRERLTACGPVTWWPVSPVEVTAPRLPARTIIAVPAQTIVRIPPPDLIPLDVALGWTP